MRGLTDSHRVPVDFQSVDSNLLASDLEGGSCRITCGTQRVEWQQRGGANCDVISFGRLFQAASSAIEKALSPNYSLV